MRTWLFVVGLVCLAGCGKDEEKAARDERELSQKIAAAAADNDRIVQRSRESQRELEATTRVTDFEQRQRAMESRHFESIQAALAADAKLPPTRRTNYQHAQDAADAESREFAKTDPRFQPAAEK